MFNRLGTWCHDHRRLILGAWVTAFLVVTLTSGAIGNGFRDEFNMPDVESRRGLDVLESDFGGQGTGVTGTIVFRAEQGVDDPAVRAAMEEVFARVSELPEVTALSSPYGPDGARFVAAEGPGAGAIAYAEVEMDEDMPFERGSEIADIIREAQTPVEGLQVELGGFIFAGFEEPSSEILGVAFAIVILILAFGSVLAMGLPLSVALLGIGIGSAVIALLSNVLTVPDFATFLGIMIGLGVGIDYALLIVTRYREQLHAGNGIRSSVGTAMDTAGRAVLFAGVTVVISLLGMLLMGITFVQGLAVGAASVVAITVVASLTLLPALIGFAGERIEVTRWRGLVASALVATALVGIGLKVPVLVAGLPLAVAVLVVGSFWAPLKEVVVHAPPKPRHETAAYRWSRTIQHRPVVFVVAAAALLVVLALPTGQLRLGFSDESNFAEDTTTYRAYSLLSEGFGPGFNGPLLLVAELPDGTDQASLEGVTAAVGADPGVAFASEPVLDDEAAPSAVLWQVAPTTGPQEEETAALVDRLRGAVLPPVEDAAGIDVSVTGAVAVGQDFSDYLTGRMPWFFAAVLSVSFVLLLVVFRSILVPLKAVVMNLLSISAAYGVVVALFQWGWLSDVTGVEPAPIEPWAPMMLFAIVFGLSMDYEVFLLSRIREEWVRTGDSRASVADGLAATAKVITAAAAIMVFVFGSFILESDRVVKLMGVGLATAIFLDATIVRMVLVPATMELLGDRNWWLPGWLDRLLPRLDVEGHGAPEPAVIDLTDPVRAPEPQPSAAPSRVGEAVDSDSRPS